jgi:hypothetical protein
VLLEGVQRVVMHEDLNWLLTRQQVSQVLDRVLQLFVSLGRITEVLPGRDKSRCIAHGLLTNEKDESDRTIEKRQSAAYRPPHSACFRTGNANLAVEK